jgi:hypothetical protein
LLSIEQSEAVDKSDQTKVMIAMQMRDKDMRDAAVLYFVTHQLQLGTLSAVY